MACSSHKTRGRTRHENAFLCLTGGRMAGKVCGHTVKHARLKNPESEEEQVKRKSRPVIKLLWSE